MDVFTVCMIPDTILRATAPAARVNCGISQLVIHGELNLKSCSEWIIDLFGGKALVSGALTSPMAATNASDLIRKVTIKPVVLKGETFYQFTSF